MTESSPIPRPDSAPTMPAGDRPPESPPSGEATSSKWVAVLRWLGLVLAAGLVLSSVAPQLPTPLKRLGLLYAALGALIGAAAAWLAVREIVVTKDGAVGDSGLSPSDRCTGFPRTRRLTWGVLLVTLASLLNTAFLSARQHREAAIANFARDPQAAAYREMLRSAAPGDPESAAQLDQMNRRLAPRFRDYLAFRFSQITKRPAPVPELLWGTELLLGLLAAGAAFRTTCRRLGAP